MTNQIDAHTLREWLDTQHPVTVLDVRSEEDRQQWAIPGSLHVDAYTALQNGEAGPLADLVLPAEHPVVTVCNAGRISQTAAAVLERRGFDARSLTGGMKAWSLAWNTADVPIAATEVRVVQVRRTGKGCLSYIVASQGDAVVIDASVEPNIYVDLARQQRWSIRYVLDTHIHADHLSRARELAGLTGAALLLPPQNRARFAFRPIADDEEIRVGATTLRAMQTPGHTAESMSFLLGEAAVFTGDTLFTNGVGRPDLHADPEAARARASALFVSLNRLRTLPPDVLVLPGHTSEPVAFDGRPVAARMAAVTAWLGDWLTSERAFFDRVTAHLPPTPPNFARIVELNEAGECPAAAAELEAGANRCAVR
ncbi:MAG: MBL fold metallo-hydrolase [Vicinamibacteraceae bacterium]